MKHSAENEGPTTTHGRAVDGDCNAEGSALESAAHDTHAGLRCGPDLADPSTHSPVIQVFMEHRWCLGLREDQQIVCELELPLQQGLQRAEAGIPAWRVVFGCFGEQEGLGRGHVCAQIRVTSWVALTTLPSRLRQKLNSPNSSLALFVCVSLGTLSLVHYCLG